MVQSGPGIADAQGMRGIGWTFSAVVALSLALIALPVDQPATALAVQPSSLTAPVSAPAVAWAEEAATAIVGSPDRDAYEKKVLRLTNKARSHSRNCGGVRMRRAMNLRWSTTLAITAHEHSEDMATRDYFSHATPEGISPFTRISAGGYDYRAAGENIAAGSGLASAKAVVRAWLHSPAHCRVLMKRTFREIGIGRVEGPGRWSVYWTQNFGRRR